ncbi:hypothetical protein [Clostridium sp. HMP27]|uniref:hypothetical protein n=1 Tax=Clostridium sp. HMP27 TaxID=1487921 RepID=UPI00052B5729|nr:hypothetical protein [Clostridium sp. HMP27]KGK81154.1 hypothetical protein DP68_18575 [Clostridium sp. HMP27]
MYFCYKCNKEVIEEEKFIAFYGEVLCNECSKGVEPCSNMFRLLFDISEDLLGVHYYFQKTDLRIKSQLTSVEHSRESIYIQFTTGNIVISDTSTIKKVKKPSNNIGIFEFCYMIKNSDNEIIGYIGKESDK